MPVVVPTIPMSLLGHDNETGPFPDMAGAAQDVTPSQSGSISRIGSSIYAMAPDPAGIYAMAPDPAGAPPETDLETAWGFMAGRAPPGTSALTVAANGTAFIRGTCYAHSGGHAGATGSIAVIVDEFEPIEPEHQDEPSISLPTHDYETVAEIDPGATAARRSPPPRLAWTQRAAGGDAILLDLQTSVLGYQVSVLDTHPAATMLVTPITPGLSYLWWIACYQFVGVATPGAAVSNIAFDFGPVLFAFT